MIRLIVLMMIAGGSLFVNSFFPVVEMEEREVMIQNAVMMIMEDAHFDPQDINNEFSSKAFDYYIEYIDFFVVQPFGDQ